MAKEAMTPTVVERAPEDLVIGEEDLRTRVEDKQAFRAWLEMRAESGLCVGRASTRDFCPLAFWLRYVADDDSICVRKGRLTWGWAEEWQIQQPDWMRIFVDCIDAKYDRELVSAEQALELFCAIEEGDSWFSAIDTAV
jgi:hypothetical protein